METNAGNVNREFPPFQVALVETTEQPIYQRVPAKALQLRELGLSDRIIAERLGVADKTAAIRTPR